MKAINYKKIALLAIIILFSYLAYNIQVRFWINDFQAKQIEKRLVRNFQEHKDQFEALRDFTAQFPELGYFGFGKNQYLDFEVSDTSNTGDTIPIQIFFLKVGEYSGGPIEEIKIVQDTILATTPEGYTVGLKNLIINFRGKISDPIVPKLLTYKGINMDQLKTLQEMMTQVNCIRISKSSGSLFLRYAGHWGESFYYGYPLDVGKIEENWHPLSSGFYWEHYVNGLFCGWTDW